MDRLKSKIWTTSTKMDHSYWHLDFLYDIERLIENDIRLADNFVWNRTSNVSPSTIIRVVFLAHSDAFLICYFS